MAVGCVDPGVGVAGIGGTVVGPGDGRWTRLCSKLPAPRARTRWVVGGETTCLRFVSTVQFLSRRHRAAGGGEDFRQRRTRFSRGSRRQKTVGNAGAALALGFATMGVMEVFTDDLLGFVGRVTRKRCWIRAARRWTRCRKGILGTGRLLAHSRGVSTVSDRHGGRWVVQGLVGHANAVMRRHTEEIFHLGWIRFHIRFRTAGRLRRCGRGHGDDGG